ncbi:hypothetical protein G7Y89_g6388 [Cudoniella acicularis]|uniref:Uncharacterized protein n=1 Tax=Cudoniella acicularis TaxID=354080 RepID=A0A8H4RNY3_9HELO|nr:hypothetical protein G7Y89_g6388 [Cudoniella acicularis]
MKVEGTDLWLKFDMEEFRHFWRRLIEKYFYSNEGLCKEIYRPCFHRLGHACVAGWGEGTCHNDDDSLMSSESFIEALTKAESLDRQLEEFENFLENNKHPSQQRLKEKVFELQWIQGGIQHQLEHGINAERLRLSRYGMPAAYNCKSNKICFEIDVGKFIENDYKIEEFIFNLYVIAAAAPEMVWHWFRYDLILPPMFTELWGDDGAQQQLAGIAIKAEISETRALHLARAGLAPPMLQNRFFWLHNEWAEDSAIPDSQLLANYRNASMEERRPMSYACTSQALKLFYHETVSGKNNELRENGWDYSKGVSLQWMFKEYYDFGVKKDSFIQDMFLPPGYRALAASKEEREAKATAWVVNAIQPLADWARTRKWEVSGEDLSDKLKVYQKFEDSSALLTNPYNQMKEKNFPEVFYTGSPSEQYRKAFKITQKKGPPERSAHRRSPFLSRKHPRDQRGYGPRTEMPH